jgi:hypothetical protein
VSPCRAAGGSAGRCCHEPARRHRGLRGSPRPRLTGRRPDCGLRQRNRREPSSRYSPRSGQRHAAAGTTPTGRAAVAGVVYVPPIAVAGKYRRRRRGSPFRAGVCVVRRRRRWHKDAARAALRSTLPEQVPLHGAARAAHPPPGHGPRSAASRAAASLTAWPRGHVAAIIGQRGVADRFSPGSGRTRRPGKGGEPVPGSRGALTLRRSALAIPALYLGFTWVQRAGGPPGWFTGCCSW